MDILNLPLRELLRHDHAAAKVSTVYGHRRDVRVRREIFAVHEGLHHLLRLFVLLACYENVRNKGRFGKKGQRRKAVGGSPFR